MTALYGRLPVPLQNWACTYAGWRRHRERFSDHFFRCLAEWERTVEGPLEALRRLQHARLCRLVSRARLHVPHYRALDLPPVEATDDPMRGVERILATLPPLEKAAYRDAPESFLASDVPAGRLRRGHTSGTTGSALPIWYTSDALAEEYATVWRHRRRCGVDLRAPHLSFGGQMVVPFSQQHPPFWRRNRYGRQTLFSLHHMSDANLAAYVEAIHTLPARYVQGYPSSLHRVGRALLAAGRPLPPGRLAAVFTSSESLLAFQRETIELAFGAPLRDRYGASELAVSMTACARDRLHVDMEFCIVEVEPEERGEGWVRGPLLVTGLANEATPFLRYRIGDVGTRLERPCECGRPGDVFVDVDGRIEDYVVTPEGRWVGRLDHVFKDQREVAEAQIVQEVAEAIEVRVVPRVGWSRAAEESLLKEIRARLGERLRVHVRVVRDIPREANGKLRAVKSRIGRNTA